MHVRSAHLLAFRLLASCQFYQHVKKFQKTFEFQVATSLFKIRLVIATCHLQACYNLLQQLVGFDNQLATSLFTTCNKCVHNLQQTCRQQPVARHVNAPACCNKLLQDVTSEKGGQRILTIYAIPYNIRPVSDADLFMCRI